MTEPCSEDEASTSYDDAWSENKPLFLQCGHSPGFCVGYVPYGSDPHTHRLVFAGSLGYRRSRRRSSCGCCVILRQEAGLDPSSWELSRHHLESLSWSRGRKACMPMLLAERRSSSFPERIPRRPHSTQSTLASNPEPLPPSPSCSVVPPSSPVFPDVGNMVGTVWSQTAV